MLQSQPSGSPYSPLHSRINQLQISRSAFLTALRCVGPSLHPPSSLGLWFHFVVPCWAPFDCHIPLAHSWRLRWGWASPLRYSGHISQTLPLVEVSLGELFPRVGLGGGGAPSFRIVNPPGIPHHDHHLIGLILGIMFYTIFPFRYFFLKTFSFKPS